MSWKLLPVAPLSLVRAKPGTAPGGAELGEVPLLHAVGFLTPAWHVSALNGGPRQADVLSRRACWRGARGLAARGRISYPQA